MDLCMGAWVWECSLVLVADGVLLLSVLSNSTIVSTNTITNIISTIIILLLVVVVLLILILLILLLFYIAMCLHYCHQCQHSVDGGSGQHPIMLGSCASKFTRSGIWRSNSSSLFYGISFSY